MLIVLLQDVAQQPGAGMGSWSTLIMCALIFLVFWLFMIRPQTKKQKELQKKRDAMKSGDKVVTAGGIHGKIKSINESIVSIEIANDVIIKVEKSSVYVAAEDAQQATEVAK